MIAFRVTGARAERHTAAPTLVFGMQLEAPARRIHGALLQVQLRIEPARRVHAPGEKEKLEEVFGAASRWSETQRALSWTEMSVSVPAFEGRHEVELSVACTYDLDLAATKYFHALDDGVVPLRFLFRGTVFAEGPSGVEVTMLPWDREATFALPATTWRAAMDAFFPGQGFLLLRRELLDALLARKARRALPTFDDVVAELLERGGDA